MDLNNGLRLPWLRKSESPWRRGVHGTSIYSLHIKGPHMKVEQDCCEITARLQRSSLRWYWEKFGFICKLIRCAVLYDFYHSTSTRVYSGTVDLLLPSCLPPLFGMNWGEILKLELVESPRQWRRCAVNSYLKFINCL